MSQYGNVVTTYYKGREAASGAGAAQVVFTTFAVGDGGGSVPTLSNAGTGLVNERYRAPVFGVSVNPSNPYQIDIECPLPFLDANGNPLGGFYVREVAIFDERGAQVVAGITSFEKTTAAQGQDSAFNYVVSIVVGDTAAVVVSTPSGAFATQDDITGIEENLADLLAFVVARAGEQLALDHHVRQGDERMFALTHRLRAAGL